MIAKIVDKSGKRIITDVFKIEIEFDEIDSLYVDDNKITFIEGQVSQNKEKKWQQLLP